MSKTKASGLIHYEILFIIPNKFTDDEAQKVFKKVGEIIVSNNGKISMEDYWGKRKFAYLLNNTALPSVRPLIAILENYQQIDGSVIIPEVLRKWMPGNIERIKAKK
jgi:hypothetical protein